MYIYETYLFICNDRKDVLILNGTYPNITSSWIIAEGKLTLEGPATLAEFEDAISNVVFNTVQANFTQDKSISINLDDGLNISQ